MPLDLFKTGTYEVSRPGAGVYTAGVWVPAAASTFNINASIQPLQGKDLDHLPEGFSVSGLRKLYTATELRVGGTAASSDTLTIGSVTWRVVRVEHPEGWTADPGMGFYKAMIAKVDAL